MIEISFEVEARESTPTFTWLNERSPTGIPLLEIKFPDTGEIDVAVLNRYNPIPVEIDETRSEVDECIFKGFLKNELNAQVALTGGCPGDKSFDVIINCQCLILLKT